MRRWAIRFAVSLLVSGTIHCGGSISSTNAGDGRDGGAPDQTAKDGPTPRAPKNHRPNDAQCLTTRPASNCHAPNPTNTCHADSECTKGTHGRCVVSGTDHLMCACTYDACTSDAQCKHGGPCACHGSVDVSTGNYCAGGNCKVDSDCESGSGFCSPSDPSVGCGGLPDYYCHTPVDECIDDSDCSAVSACTASGRCGCAYDTTSRRWTCQPLLACG